jgi:hypothetical protein
MAIIRTITSFREFAAMFDDMGRTHQFKNLEWLYDYLEEYSDSTGEPIGLDVIALCCEYVEESWDDVASNYPDCASYFPDEADYSDLDEGGEVIPGTLDEDGFTEAKREGILTYLREHTSVCGWDDETVMYAQF